MLVDRYLHHGLHLGRLRTFVRTARRKIGLPGDIAICLAGDREVRELNRKHGGHDAATDVLSFPAGPGPGPAWTGDVIVSIDTAGRQARRFGHSLGTEVRILVLHGLLHLAGMDHTRDDGAMQRRERQLRRQLGLPAGHGLLERVERRRTPAAARRAR